MSKLMIVRDLHGGGRGRIARVLENHLSESAETHPVRIGLPLLTSTNVTKTDEDR